MKIPFERTIAGAYRFVFANIVSIVGIGWFPFLLVGLSAIGLVYAILPQFNELLVTGQDKWSQAQLVPAVFSMSGAIFLIVILLILATAMVNVGIMRKALGQHPGPVFVFFSLGSQVWRMIGAYFLLMLLAWGVLLAFVIGIGCVSYLLSRISPTVQVLGTTLLAGASFIWGIYAAVRVQFFLPAIVVAENHIGIRRSWNLGRGNFWRILGILLLVTLPAYFALSTIISSMMQMALGAQLLPMSGWPPDPAHPAMTAEELQHYFTTLLGALRSIWPYMAVVELLYVIVVTGLTAGAIANAYNLVTGGPDIAPSSSSTKASA